MVLPGRFVEMACLYTASQTAGTNPNLNYADLLHIHQCVVAKNRGMHLT